MFAKERYLAKYKDRAHETRGMLDAEEIRTMMDMILNALKNTKANEWTQEDLKDLYTTMKETKDYIERLLEIKGVDPLWIEYVHM